MQAERTALDAASSEEPAAQLKQAPARSPGTLPAGQDAQARMLALAFANLPGAQSVQALAPLETLLEEPGAPGLHVTAPSELGW